MWRELWGQVAGEHAMPRAAQGGGTCRRYRIYSLRTRIRAQITSQTIQHLGCVCAILEVGKNTPHPAGYIGWRHVGV